MVMFECPDHSKHEVQARRNGQLEGMIGRFDKLISLTAKTNNVLNPTKRKPLPEVWVCKFPCKHTRQVSGFWVFSAQHRLGTKQIFIHSEMLNNKIETYALLLHEYIHYIYNEQSESAAKNYTFYWLGGQFPTVYSDPKTAAIANKILSHDLIIEIFKYLINYTYLFRDYFSQ
jgi:hypothetical protein